MNDTLTRKTASPASRSRSETKADVTDNTARAILEAEADRREAKTARLRQARAEMEAAQPAPEPAAPKGRAKKAPARGSTKAA